MHSTKYDGSLHYRYPVELVDQSADRLVTYFEPGSPVESYRGSWSGTKHILTIFWHQLPYVLHVRWDDARQPEFLYVDIATDTRWGDGTVRYIDLDLDLIRRAGSSTIELDDEDEFEDHQTKWNYPAELVQDCWSAVKTVRGLLETGKPPFAFSMFDWTRGKPLDV
jgi:hypothetical protein